MTGTADQESNDDSGNSPFHEDAEQVLDRVTDAFFALNHDWEFTYVNPSAATLLNRSATDLVDNNIWEEFPEAADLAFKSQYQNAIETRSPVSFEEYFPPLEAWFAVRAYPSETGLSVYFRDVTVGKQYKERLATIHETTRQMMHAETPADIADIAVKSVRNILGFPAVTFYYWNDETGVLEPTAATDVIAERYEYDMPTLTGDESLIWDVFVDGETRVYDGAQPPHDEMYNPNPAIQRRVAVPLDNHGVFFAGSETRGEIIDVTVELLEILADNVTAALERAEREQSLIEKDEQLQHTNEQLSNLKDVNRILREIDQALIQATQRSEIETAVCEKLTDVDTYQLAWFGKPDSQTNEITIQASAGDNPTYPDQLVTLKRDDRPPIPAEKAIQAGDTIFTENILEASSQAPWREEALNKGYRSIASLPIRFHGITYGILEIYADHPNAFSDEERAVLRELGEVIGNALNAIERKKALLAETSVELTFRLTESESLASRIATQIDGKITVESLLPRSDDTWLVYFTATNTDPETVVETTRNHMTVESVEHLRSASSDHLFGLILTELPNLDFFAENGATTTSIKADPTETEFTVEIPKSANVRSFIQTCQTRYPNIELVSQQQISAGDSHATKEELIGELTDQQHKALEAALESGFFAWPREKTGEEVAESLGVTPPTFHRHLRVALKKVVSAVLE